MKRTAVGHTTAGVSTLACAVAYCLLVATAAIAAERPTSGVAAKPAMKGASAASAPDYARDVAPLFRKYCLGCHNAQEAQGGLVLESYNQTLHGGEHGASVLAGNAEKSRLILVLEKRIEPAMPPKGNKGPSAAEIGVLKSWIQAGAHAPAANSPAVAEIVAPKIEPVGKARNPISAVAFAPDGRWIAAARYGCVEILSAPQRTSPGSGSSAFGKPVLLKTLSAIAGNVNGVGFSADGTLLFAAAGDAGLFGELSLWNTSDWSRRLTLRGHHDALLGAALSPDGKIVATASYDQTIRLWSVATGKELRVLKGHNGAVFDVAFDPTSRLLASASGDRTVKLWDVANGERLDTFSQPTKDQYAVAFSPDGQRVIAGGVDSRIRVWQISSSAKEGTNPLIESLFAHDGPIVRLAVSRDGRWIASSSEDRTIKIWDAARFTQVEKLADQSDWTTALAIAPDNRTIAAGRMDGSLSISSFGGQTAATTDTATPLDYAKPPQLEDTPSTKIATRAEVEPNDSPAHPMDLMLPVRVNGVLSLGKDGLVDADFFRFRAKAGQTWILETEAARKSSPADTRIDVLHADGSPVVRCLLRAVRDSSVTFRPIDSRQGGVRVENWQEMDLDQFLYMSGEVCRLFRAPRGPDSEYDLYSQNGARRCYFDTSAVSHTLNETIYIVEPYAPGTRLSDNGLPIFPVFYTNDDDGSRKLGHDSRLTFTAPADGTYLVRVTDVRGYGGPNFKYSLTIREPKPDFSAAFGPDKLSVASGGGQRFSVAVERMDNFEGPVRIEVSGMPQGYHVTTPLVIEKGLNNAEGSVNADAGAKPIPPAAWKSMHVTATATINGREVTKSIPGLREVNLGPPAKVVVHLRPDLGADKPAGESSDTPSNRSSSEIVIEPGESVTAMLEIDRHGYQGELRFEIEDLPHGVIVDNIGLNGIMVRAGENRRQVFLTAGKWVRPTTRLIHAVADREGGQTSLPIALRVVAKSP
jgi:WD40 repeat protein